MAYALNLDKTDMDVLASADSSVDEPMPAAYGGRLLAVGVAGCALVALALCGGVLDKMGDSGVEVEPKVTKPANTQQMVSGVMDAAKQEIEEHEGTIIESLPKSQFRVDLDNGFNVIAFISGDLRRNYIHITTGDKVRVELTPYDKTKGKIVSRIRRR